MLRIYNVMLKVVRELVPVLEQIEAKDRSLGQQMRDAMSSMILNTGEGMGSFGGTRRARYRTACGSAKETRACLDAGEAFGFIKAPETDLPLVINTLYRVSFTRLPITSRSPSHGISPTYPSANPESRHPRNSPADPRALVYRSLRVPPLDPLPSARLSTTLAPARLACLPRSRSFTSIAAKTGRIDLSTSSMTP
jgi:four helix bundle protein